MSHIVCIDTGVLGYLTHPRANEKKDCMAWLKSLLYSGWTICIPEIADYELRREYLLNNSTTALK